MKIAAKLAADAGPEQVRSSSGRWSCCAPGTLAARAGCRAGLRSWWVGAQTPSPFTLGWNSFSASYSG